MNKRGFLSLLFRISLFLVLITFLLFYILSQRNSHESALSAKATLENVAKNLDNLAKESSKNFQKPENKSNSEDEIINISKSKKPVPDKKISVHISP